MAQFTHEQYDALERAVAEGRRVALMRRGTEYVVVPHRLTQRGGREIIETRNPSTGDRQNFFLDEVDGFDVV
jgi:hypothetical protein